MSRTALIEQSHPFRTATHPFWITPKERDFFKQLGNRLLAFYRAANRLYFDSVDGMAPSWVSGYLDHGKPASVIEQGRRSRSRQHLPGIIRPDIILTQGGMIATELDAIPGGIGLTLQLSRAYDTEGLLGGTDGMRDGFARMIRALSPLASPPSLAIVVSEESRSYFSEMEFLGKALTEIGLTTFVVAPEAVSFSEEGCFVLWENECRPIQILYRFFELFDLKNIPQSAQILHAAQYNQLVLTPPPKGFLEEKLLFSFLHHPDLRSFWINAMGEETTSLLTKLFPKTWILDPRLSTPIPSLMVRDHTLSGFMELGRLSQKARQFIIKPSGFSELAWGSRGVRVGHDLSEEEWSGALQMALDGFDTTPYILQPFHKGRRVEMKVIDHTNTSVRMEGRVRLSPYYFVEGEETFLGGILATVCPLDKKLIHGMSEAIMAPCAVLERLEETAR